MTPLTRSARPAPPVTRRHRARCAALADELVEARERSGIEDANQVPEVLADDDVVRHLERSLLSIAAHERRPIPLREERDRERDGEERDRRDRSARPARQSDGRKPSRKSATPAVGPESRQHRKDPRDDERCGDRDEAGEQEQEKRRSLAASELLFVSGAADERHSDDEHRSRGNEVECSDPRALALRKRHGDKDENGCDDSGRDRDAEPDRRQDALAQHVDHGRSCELRDDAGDGDPRNPAENDPGNRNRAALDPTEQPQLPPLRSEPGEPPSRGLEVAAHAPRSEDREREQKRRAFPADEEEARSGDVRRALDLPQLVHGPLDRERRRALGQLDARTFGALHELVDVPEARLARADGPDPRVRAVRACELRRRRERGAPLGDDEWRRRRSVVLARLPELGWDGRVGSCGIAGEEKVPVELARAQRSCADLDDPKARGARQRSAAAQAEHLAPVGRARARQTTRSQDHVLVHAVDRRDADEPSRHGALAEQDQGRRSVEPEAGERLVDGTIERGESFARIARDAEPHRPHRTLRSRDALDRLRRRAIARDGDAREDSCENSRRDREPEDGDERSAVAAPKTLPGKRGDEPRGSHVSVLRRCRYAAVFVRFPQIDIEHHREDALREAS